MDKIFNLDSKVMQLANKFADLMLLNVLTIICCLPIITIGPAITAMHYVLLKLYRNEGIYIIKSYFKSFKENFIQGVFLGLIYVVIAAVLIIDLIYIRNMENVNLIIEIVVIVAIVLAAFSYVWVFPLQSRYENKIRTTVKNSFMVGALNFTKSIMMIIISAAPILVFMMTTSALPILTLLGLTVPAYVQTMLYSQVFDKMEGIDRSVEALQGDDGWEVKLEDGETLPEKDESWKAGFMELAANDPSLAVSSGTASEEEVSAEEEAAKKETE